MPQPGPPADDNARLDDEIDEVLGAANPNPDRVGCPTRETLVALALREQPLSDPAYEHLVKCSPCYREFRALQRSAVSARVIERSAVRKPWIAAAAAAVVVGVIGTMWYSGRRPAPSQRSPDSVELSQPTLLRTSLDLRNFAVLRSDRPQEQPPPVTLPAGRIDLTMLLPVGSEPGSYDVQLLDSELRSRAEAMGTAEVINFVTTVHALLDLRPLAAGPYQLALRRQGDDWKLFPAIVQ